MNNAGNIYGATEITINAFKHKMFQYYQESYFEDRDEIRDYNGIINHEKVKMHIYLREEEQNDDLIKKHLMVQDLRLVLKDVNKTKNKTENKIKLMQN